MIPDDNKRDVHLKISSNSEIVNAKDLVVGRWHPKYQGKLLIGDKT
jgi:hypothetical protein